MIFEKKKSSQKQKSKKIKKVVDKHKRL